MDTCIKRMGNLTDETQNKNLRVGVVAFTATLVVAALMLKFDVAVGYRLLLFLPFLVSVNLVYMALYKTCGIMAARGVRVSDDEGTEKIANPEERAAMWQIGRRVILSTVCTATLATLLVALLPAS